MLNALFKPRPSDRTQWGLRLTYFFNHEIKL